MTARLALVLALAAGLLAASPARALDARELAWLKDSMTTLISGWYRHAPGDAERDDYVEAERGQRRPGFTWWIVFRSSEGAALAVAEDAGDERARIALRTIYSRVLWLRDRPQDALDANRELLARGAALGLSDRQLHGLLRDMAGLAAQLGDAAAADDYAARASACDFPCAEDIVHELMAAVDATDLSPAELDGDAKAAAASRFVEREFGRESAEFLSMRASLSENLKSTRPWDALEVLQDVVEIQRVARPDDPARDANELDLADQLLRVGEYRRLVGLMAELPTRLDARRRQGALARQDDRLGRALRLQARALWHMRDRRAEAAYAALVTELERLFAHDDFRAGRLAETAVFDLLDADYRALLQRLLDAGLARFSGDRTLITALARLRARNGDFAGAARLSGDLADALQREADHDPEMVGALRIQQAAYLEGAGDPAAAALRASVTRPGAEDQGAPNLFWSPPKFTGLRDAGGYEGAAWLVEPYLPHRRAYAAEPAYLHAQWLWQMSYTMARVGRQGEAFELMRSAAAMAVGLSFAEVDATDGGSLQLLRRDRGRYLLFVDIAWGAIAGEPAMAAIHSGRY